jgi:predicted nucleic-acid-binding protein
VIALDTSVLARLLLGDDPDQQLLAERLVHDNACCVGWSVLVELCWVLERSANLPRAKVAAAFRLLQEIDGISFHSEDAFDWAIARYEGGADFADMVHLASALSHSTGFATFDRKLEPHAGQPTPLPIQTLRA